MMKFKRTTDGHIDLGLMDKMMKIPGGLVIIPLLLAVGIKTFFPSFFEIGGFTSGLFKNGQPALMGLFLILCGASINVRQVGMPLYKGVVLTSSKFFLGVAIGLAVGTYFGPEGIWGLSPIVLIAAITNSNSSLYISLSSQFGNSTDTGAISILSLNDGPFFTLVALGASGLANVPFMAVVATLIPLLIGFIWGNLDSTFRKLCSKAQPVIIFIMTIAIGSNTNIDTILVAGASGIILGLLSTLTAAVFFYIFNIFLPKRERNAMGAAIGTTALNSAMTPAAVADADPTFAPHVPLATAQCATASIITLFLCPFIVAFFDRQMRKNKLGIYSPEGWAGQKLAAEQRS
ncbi:2-keto-3-deoxygluconate permease [Conservatibacter flavescens]|uniref:2-keto-3-deoxygluconate permease n=1 Tax=Conservatibacter flavescens TaxID=28161 RepID=A0A2M8RZX8_9PAST|nr:2-keto-3-deoxygluconate permease [Conservatibacter flavescens]PJG84452.1 2-keto-3-deoxygluconate permease [Conservatibacter flavescens]